LGSGGAGDDDDAAPPLDERVQHRGGIGGSGGVDVFTSIRLRKIDFFRSL
jgi:hypothetical protein